MAPPRWLAVTASWTSAWGQLDSTAGLLSECCQRIATLESDPDSLGALSSINGLHSRLVVAHANQISDLLSIISIIVTNDLSSLIAELDSVFARIPGSNLHHRAMIHTVISTYEQERVRLRITFDRLQQAVRSDMDWGQAASLSRKLGPDRSVSNPSFVQAIRDLRATSSESNQF
uniref:Uncharacterized protein n=1 Tax=Spongospora subterranea TaxID=70186 RepID=A0A0H5R9U5_9EUKA|eukprot:CRZ10561.1 hypothetical protein [Spongospora subterranea]